MEGFFVVYKCHCNEGERPPPNDMELLVFVQFIFFIES